MTRTPGFLVPSSFASDDELEKELHRQSEAAGFTTFDPDKFLDKKAEHSTFFLTNNPPLAAVYLAHFGTKGMRWGHRKDTRFSDKQIARTKKIATVGSLVVAGVLHRHGKLTTTAVATGGMVGRGLGFVGSHVLSGALNTAYFVGNVFTEPIAQVGKLY